MPRPSVVLGGVSALTLAAAATVPSLLGAGVRTAHAAVVAEKLASPRRAHPGASAVPHRTLPHSPRVPTPIATRPATHAKRMVASPHASPSAPVEPVRQHDPAAAVASVDPTSSGGVAIIHPRIKHHRLHKATGRTASPTQSGGAAPTTPPLVSTAYVNPLAHARVSPERIDQGVDYSGSGTLTALGAGQVTYSATAGTGWPGAFVEYRLTTGAEAGRYVFYAESISPRVRVGQVVRPGQAVATMSGGIEIGWGAGIGTEALAMAQGQWSSYDDSHNVASPAGRNFSALIASLGGQPGKVG